MEIRLGFGVLGGEAVASLFDNASFLFLCLDRFSRGFDLLLTLRGELLLGSKRRFSF